MKLLTVCLVVLATCCVSVAAEPPPAQAQDEPFLPIGLTEEEKTRLDEIGQAHRSTAAPIAGVRNPAEWEPSQGVLVRWPLGIPVSLVAEMSEDVVVTTVVPDAAAQASATSSYSAGGANMANVDFVIAPTDSIWIRDYGPWFVYEGTQLAIVDHIYNRPRPLDDVVPQAVGDQWGLSVYGMDLIHTGGNHMSDGLGNSSSTELVYDENPTKTRTQVDQQMLDYLGNDYTVLDYVNAGGIHHIDTWAKFLGPSTVMVKDVPLSDPSHDELDARAEYLASRPSPWGVPWNVVRIFCPSGTWYTNSLILNDKVLVPLFGVSEDAIALETYRDAMPGYEVLGFSGSWAVEDALHCRTMGVPDAGVLAIDHVPLRSEEITPGDYELEAVIVPHSGAALSAPDLAIHYSVDGGLWQESPLMPTGASDTYAGTIPAQTEDSIVAYYLEAADASGRVETHPYIGEPWAHEFTAICPSHPLVDVTPDGPTAVCASAGVQLAAELTGGSGPFSYQWLEDGLPIQDATSASYTANAAGAHTYNCEVRGDGCVNPRLDAEAVEVSWQLEPLFAGLSSVANVAQATCTLELSWSAGAAVCAGPVTYKIYRSTTPGFAPGPANLLVAGVTGTGYDDTSGLQSGTTYHYVVRAEDLSNGAEEPNGIERSAAPTGVSPGSVVLLDGTFDDALAWNGWSVTTGPGPHTCGAWEQAVGSTQRPPGGVASYALADSEVCGPGSSTSTDLTSPEIDTDHPSLGGVTLEFDLAYRYGDGDATSIEAWNGSDWVTVWTAPAASVDGHQVIDVTSHALGNPAFRVRFRYQNASHDHWFAVDNVVLTGTIAGPCATAAATVSTVPDGRETGTAPVRVARDGNGLEIRWDAATSACRSSDYHLIWGFGADVSEQLVSGSACDLGSSGIASWPASADPAPGEFVWFLVVGDDGGAVEGGWGTDAFGTDRSAVASGECGTVTLDPASCVP